MKKGDQRAMAQGVWERVGAIGGEAKYDMNGGALIEEVWVICTLTRKEVG